MQCSKNLWFVRFFTGYEMVVDARAGAAIARRRAWTASARTAAPPSRRAGRLCPSLCPSARHSPSAVRALTYAARGVDTSGVRPSTRMLTLLMLCTAPYAGHSAAAKQPVKTRTTPRCRLPSRSLYWPATLAYVGIISMACVCQVP